jgi:acetyltransferase-like isoleucine patch superfamily enzyme
MTKVIKALLAELQAFVQWVVMHFPGGYLGSRIRRLYWGIRLRNRKLTYIGYGASIHHCHLLRLGERFVLGDYAALEVADSDPVYIGSDVAMANGSYLRSANHCFDDLLLPIQRQGHSSKRIDYKGNRYSIVIEDNVWLAAKSIILTGAFIGEGSVIAAGSVVSSAVPPFSIVAGNPARVIANRKKMVELQRAAGDDNGKI